MTTLPTDFTALGAPESPADRVRAFSTFAAWAQTDPIGAFAEVRAHAKMARSEEFGGFWIPTRYAEIEWVARNPEIFSSAEPLIPYARTLPEKAIPLELDGEVHTAWRKALADAFSPSVAQHFLPQIEELARELVEAAVRSRKFDFASEFAVKLPASVFLVNFGVDPSALDQLLEFKNWYVREGLTSDGSDGEVAKACKPLLDFFQSEVDRRRFEGYEGHRDVMSKLLSATYQGRALTDAEVVNAAFVTMMASLDTTTSALGLIWLTLTQRTDLRAQVINEPDQIPQMMEELIRYQPVLTTARVVTQEVERDGVTLHPGDRVLMSWGMAGRDPDVYDRADECLLDRPPNRTLAFGVGPHRCLGMHLARRIITVAMREWHARIPDYRLDPDGPPISYYSPVRGVMSLPLLIGKD
ncbi:cytochrome P450 [[Mycobacterium] vasticus]|uniref:Cytochrome P450 n=1 Tax=[Mycobacterium] vasticus TaxID=2875777 RepID=A0ABU5Z2Q1_9MYCO|nr:cytochrome P450 [Mycolicibacter sp. MYC017]MEB3071681.1 cytochrome P450 [Mycolicibacter sp. MYC017]